LSSDNIFWCENYSFIEFLFFRPKFFWSLPLESFFVCSSKSLSCQINYYNIVRVQKIVITRSGTFSQRYVKSILWFGMKWSHNNCQNCGEALRLSFGDNKFLYIIFCHSRDITKWSISMTFMLLVDCVSCRTLAYKYYIFRITKLCKVCDIFYAIRIGIQFEDYK
jgi:hypothetical protein